MWLFKNWRIVVSLLIAVTYAVYSFFSTTAPSIESLNKLIAMTLSTLLALQIAESIDIGAHFKSARADSRRDFRDTLNEASQYSTRLVERRTTSDYVDLFADLTGEFLSYNPHQFSEQGRLEESEIVENLQRRYKNKSFQRASFVICIGDEYGRDNYRRYMLRLDAICQDTNVKNEALLKIQIRTSRRPFLSEPTFHLQHKDIDRSVVELRMRGLTVGATVAPRIYLVSNFKNLLTYQRNYFDAEFADAIHLDWAAVLNEIAESQDKEAALEAHIAKLASFGASA